LTDRQPPRQCRSRSPRCRHRPQGVAHRIRRRCEGGPAELHAEGGEGDSEARCVSGEPAHPSPCRRVQDKTTLRRRPDPVGAFGDGLEHGTDRLDRIEPVPEAERREQGVGLSAPSAHAPGDPDPVHASLVADGPEVTRPEAHRLRAVRALGPRNLDPPAGRRVGVDGERAGQYDGHRWQHRLGPLPQASDQLAAGGVPRVQGPPILAVRRPAGPRACPARPQRARPKATLASSDNQAANTRDIAAPPSPPRRSWTP